MTVKVTGVVGIGLAVLVGLGFQQQEAKVPEVMEVKELRIVDNKGNTRITLNAKDRCGRIEILDEKENVRLALRMNEHDMGTIEWFDAEGQIRMFGCLLNEGGPTFALQNKNFIPRVSLTIMGPDGLVTICNDRDGEGAGVQVGGKIGFAKMKRRVLNAPDQKDE